MPELPELEVIKENLTSQIKGKNIKRLKIFKPYILKRYFTECLTKEKVQNIQRRGKYLIIVLTHHKIIIHLMLRGSVRYSLPTYRVKKTTAALLEFEDGTVLELSETGHKKMMSLYILSKGDILRNVENCGMDPLSDNFTLACFKTILQEEPQQLKSLLRNQRKIAGIGNAYADEILWKAQLSPFRLSTNLTNSEIEQLYEGIIEILAWAIATIRKKGISEKRDFLNVHQRRDLPCPRCNETIHMVSSSHSDTFYCPRCQTKGRILKDRRISKLFR